MRFCIRLCWSYSRHVLNHRACPLASTLHLLTYGQWVNRQGQALLAQCDRNEDPGNKILPQLQTEPAVSANFAVGCWWLGGLRGWVEATGMLGLPWGSSAALLLREVAKKVWRGVSHHHFHWPAAKQTQDQKSNVSETHVVRFVWDEKLVSFLEKEFFYRMYTLILTCFCLFFWQQLGDCKIPVFLKFCFLSCALTKDLLRICSIPGAVISEG